MPNGNHKARPETDKGQPEQDDSDEDKEDEGNGEIPAPGGTSYS